MKNRKKLRIVGQESPKPIRVAILGQDSVGKSAFTVRLLTKRYIGEYGSASETTYRYNLTLDRDVIPLDVTDTVGENSVHKLDGYSESSDFLVVLYSIIDHNSFKEAARIARYVRTCKDPEFHPTEMIVAGTKLDMERYRQVDKEEGEILSEELNCGFYEISISESYADTIFMFKDAMRQYVEYHPLLPSPPSSSPRGSMGNLSLKEKDRSPPGSWSMMKGLRTSFRKKSISVS